MSFKTNSPFLKSPDGPEYSAQPLGGLLKLTDRGQGSQNPITGAFRILLEVAAEAFDSPPREDLNGLAKLKAIEWMTLRLSCLM